MTFSSLDTREVRSKKEENGVQMEWKRKIKSVLILSILRNIQQYTKLKEYLNERVLASISISLLHRVLKAGKSRWLYR